MRRILPVLLTLTCGCEVEGRLRVVGDSGGEADAADGGADADAARGDSGTYLTQGLSVIQLNLANLDLTNKGPCPAYHQGTQCERSVEQDLRAYLFVKEPSNWEIVVLNNVWDQDRCFGQNESDAKLVCHDYASADPYQQVRRLLGSNYTIVCDDKKRSSCVGVRKGKLDWGSTLEVENCAAGALCYNAKTPSVPPACAGQQEPGGVSAVYLKLWPAKSFKTVGALRLTVVNVQAFAGAKDDTQATACRLAQYQQAFQLATGQRVLIAGDLGSDPRLHGCKYKDIAYWCHLVGHDKSFHYHTVTSVTRLSDNTAVDVVASNFLGSQPCGLSVPPLPAKPVWKRLDHRPIRCNMLGLAIGGGPTCGDLTCMPPEDCLNCEKDCGKCTCGDGWCDPVINESCTSCMADCGQC